MNISYIVVKIICIVFMGDNIHGGYPILVTIVVSKKQYGRTRTEAMLTHAAQNAPKL